MQLSFYSSILISYMKTGKRAQHNFWKKHNYAMVQLCKLAGKYLSAPLMSVPSEVIFSTGGLTVRKAKETERKTFRCSVFVK